jgi:hypothetical protein
MLLCYTDGADAAIALAERDGRITLLTERVRALEKAQARLTDVFRDRIAAFRDACKSLFGYRCLQLHQHCFQNSITVTAATGTHGPQPLLGACNARAYPAAGAALQAVGCCSSMWQVRV